MTCKKIALIGANGMLANMLKKNVPQSVELSLFDLPEFDVTCKEQVVSQLFALKPDVVINCAAFTNVDGCESQRELAFLVNGDGPGILAEVTKQLGATLVHISTDFVFSGKKTTPYLEEDSTEPLSVYGQSKLQGEQALLCSGLKNYYIIRTSWLYGPDGSNFVETIARLAVEREELGIVADQLGTPTYTGDLAEAIFTLLGLTPHSSLLTSSCPYGIYHYSNDGVCSWYEFAGEIVEQLRKYNIPIKLKELKPITTAEYPVPAQRPAYSVLSKDKYMKIIGAQVPDWRNGLDRYFKNRSKAVAADKI